MQLPANVTPAIKQRTRQIPRFPLETAKMKIINSVCLLQPILNLANILVMFHT